MDTERSNNFNIVIGFKSRCILAIKFSIDTSGFVGKDCAFGRNRRNNRFDTDFFFVFVQLINLLDSMSSHNSDVDFSRGLADSCRDLDSSSSNGSDNTISINGGLSLIGRSPGDRIDAFILIGFREHIGGREPTGIADIKSQSSIGNMDNRLRRNRLRNLGPKEVCIFLSRRSSAAHPDSFDIIVVASDKSEIGIVLDF